jgi:hypothetical protein
MRCDLRQNNHLVPKKKRRRKHYQPKNIVGYHGGLTTLIKLAKVLLNNLRQLCYSTQFRHWLDSSYIPGVALGDTLCVYTLERGRLKESQREASEN